MEMTLSRALLLHSSGSRSSLMVPLLDCGRLRRRKQRPKHLARRYATGGDMVKMQAKGCQEEAYFAGMSIWLLVLRLLVAP